jgi:ubiquinone/menaquinone biosynthesis C-methylase UbiE
MGINREEICEACGNKMQNWQIATDCILFRCPNCLHIKRDLSISNAMSRESAWGGNEFFDDVRNKLTLRRLNKYLASKKKLSVLEIGFGKGSMLSNFIKKGYKTSGIEAEYLKIQIDEFAEKNSKLFFGKAESIELPDKEFDVIYGIHLIEHLDSPSIVFKKCFKALKDDGLIYFMTPNSTSKGLSFFKDKWWNLEDPTHVRFFSPKSVMLMLNKSGFKKVITNTPISDSLSVEINSTMRYFKQKSKTHGILDNKLIQILNLSFLPSFLLVRVFYPKIAPSMEIIAYKI